MDPVSQGQGQYQQAPEQQSAYTPAVAAEQPSVWSPLSFQQQAPESQQADPNQGEPLVAPNAAVTPPEAVAPPAPQYSEAEVARLRQEAANFRQLQTELQQFAIQQQQAQAEQRLQEQAQSRMDRVYQQAETMEPARAFEFIRQNQEAERADFINQIRNVQSQGQQQLQHAVKQIAAPLYARDLAKQNGLPDEYAERLAMLPGDQMDTYLPILKRDYQDRKALQDQLAALSAQITQSGRSNQVQQIQQQGAHQGGGAGASPIPPVGNQPEKGSREHLLSLLPAEFLG